MPRPIRTYTVTSERRDRPGSPVVQTGQSHDMARGMLGFMDSQAGRLERGRGVIRLYASVFGIPLYVTIRREA